MTRNYFLFPVFLLLMWTDSYAAPPQDAGQIKRNCYQSYRDSSKITCEVSPLAIIANPQQFEGVNITTTGYLRRIGDVLVLFPSKDIYVFSAGRWGIELMGASSKLNKLLDKKSECSQAVTVIADFTAQIRGSLPGMVGVFHGDIGAFLEDMPGEPPKKQPDSR